MNLGMAMARPARLGRRPSRLFSDQRPGCARVGAGKYDSWTDPFHRTIRKWHRSRRKALRAARKHVRADPTEAASAEIDCPLQRYRHVELQAAPRTVRAGCSRD